MHLRGRIVAWTLDALAVAVILGGLSLIVVNHQRESSVAKLQGELTSTLTAAAVHLDRVAGRIPPTIEHLEELADTGAGLAVIAHDLSVAVAGAATVGEHTASLMEALRDDAASAAAATDLVPPFEQPGSDQVGPRIGALAEVLNRSLDDLRRLARVTGAFQRTTLESDAALRSVGEELRVVQSALTEGALRARALRSAVEAASPATAVRRSVDAMAALGMLFGALLLGMATVVRAVLPARQDTPSPSGAGREAAGREAAGREAAGREAAGSRSREPSSSRRRWGGGYPSLPPPGGSAPSPR